VTSGAVSEDGNNRRGHAPARDPGRRASPRDADMEPGSNANDVMHLEKKIHFNGER
jgi:hypothetical protein